MSRVIIGHFGDESLQSVTCTGTDKPEQPRDRTLTKHKYHQCNPQNGPNKQQHKTLKKPRLRERTDRAWFSRLLRHPVMKPNRSLFLQPRSPHGATKHRQLTIYYLYSLH